MPLIIEVWIAAERSWNSLQRQPVRAGQE